MSRRLEISLNVLLVLAALLMAVSAVDRQFFSNPAPPQEAPLTFVDNWERLLDQAIIIGNVEAPVKILKFADLQCPFCRRFHESFVETQSEFGSEVALAFVHYPLRSHEMAVPAAVAAECADQQNRFGSFIETVYTSQDSLSVWPWNRFAEEAQMPDISGFESCITSHDTFPRIQQGRALGEELNVSGTPTVIVNGWRFSTPPYERLGRVVAELLAGQTPQ